MADYESEAYFTDIKIISLEEDVPKCQMILIEKPTLELTKKYKDSFEKELDKHNDNSKKEKQNLNQIGESKSLKSTAIDNISDLGSSYPNLDEKDKKIMKVFNYDKKDEPLKFLISNKEATTIEKNLDKTSQFFEGLGDFLERLYYILIYKFPEVEVIYKNASLYFSKNFKKYNDMIKYLNDFEIDNKYIKKLTIKILQNKNDKVKDKESKYKYIFIEQIKDLSTFKDEKDNFYVTMQNLIDTIANDKIIYDTNDFIKSLVKTKNEFFEPFIELFNSDKKQCFLDKSHWKINRPKNASGGDVNQVYLESLSKFYLFFFNNQIDFFANIFKETNSSLVSSLNNVLDSINRSFNLLKFNLIKKDDLFALVYFNGLKSINDFQIFGYIYPLIPFRDILKLFNANENKQFSDVIKYYFDIINNLNNENVIYFIDEKDKNINNNKIFKNNKCSKIEKADICNKLKMENNTNKEQFAISNEYIDKISYLYKYYRVRINVYNDFLFGLFDCIKETNGEINLKIKKSAEDQIIEVTNQYIKSKNNGNDFNLSEICKSTPKLKNIIFDYLNKNIKKIVKEMDNENQKEINDLKKYEEETYHLMRSKLAKYACHIYSFMNDNKIISNLKNKSPLITSQEDFNNKIEDDFITNKIEIFKKNKENKPSSENGDLFYDIIDNSFSKLKEEMLDEYKKYVNSLQSETMNSLGSISNQETEQIDLLKNRIIEISERLPSFINTIESKHFRKYITRLVLSDLNKKFKKQIDKSNIIYQIIELITNSFFASKNIKSNKELLIYVYMYFYYNKKFIFLLELIQSYINTFKKLELKFQGYESSDKRKLNKYRELIEPIDIALESLLRLFKADSNYTKFYLENFDYLTNVINTAEKISRYLKLYSQELNRITSIKILLHFIKFQSFADQEFLQHSDEFISNIENTSNLSIEDEYELLNKIYFSQNHMINEPYFLVKYYINKYNKEENNEIRSKLISKITSDYKYIAKSKEFFDNLFSEYVNFNILEDKLKQDLSVSSSNIKFLEDLNIEELNDEVIELLTFNNKEQRNDIISLIEKSLTFSTNSPDPEETLRIKALEQIIINVFENILLKIFDINVDPKKYYINKIVSSYVYRSILLLTKLSEQPEQHKSASTSLSSSFNEFILLNSMNLSAAPQPNSNKRSYPLINSLFTISFLKVYFSGFLYLTTKDSNKSVTSSLNESFDFSWICSLISAKSDEADVNLLPPDDKIKWIIKTYVLKLLRRKLSSYFKFQTFNFINNQMIWVSSFKFRELFYSNFDYIFFSCMGTLPDEINTKYLNDYEDITKLMISLSKETYRTGKYDKDICSLIKSENFDCFIDYCFNNILSNCYDGEFLSSLEYNEFTMWIENLLKTGEDLFSDLYTNKKKELLWFFKSFFIQNFFIENVLCKKNKKDNEGENNEPKDLNCINDLDSLEIILLAFKISLPFILKDNVDITKIGAKIIAKKHLVLYNPSYSIDMGNHLENNKFSVNKDYYFSKKIDESKSVFGNLDLSWKLCSETINNNLFKKEEDLFNKNFANSLQNPSSKKNIDDTYNNFTKNITAPQMLYVQAYNTVNHQGYDINKNNESLKKTAQNRLYVCILYSLYYVLSFKEKMNSGNGNAINTNENYNIDNKFLINVYKDLINSLHLIGIDNEKIFFNILYQELKNYNSDELFKNLDNICINILDYFPNNKNTYLKYIHKITEYDPTSMRNILEDQKYLYNEYERQEILGSNYSKYSEFYNNFKIMKYFYNSLYPDYDNFCKEFTKIYQYKNKYPLISFIIENRKKDSSFCLNGMDSESIENMINYYYKNANDYTKVDINYLLNIGKKNEDFLPNRFDGEDDANFEYDDDFFFEECIRKHSYRNIYGDGDVDFCNGDLILYDFQEIEREIEMFIIGFCKMSKAEDENVKKKD